MRLAARLTHPATHKFSLHHAAGTLYFWRSLVDVSPAVFSIRVAHFLPSRPNFRLKLRRFGLRRLIRPSTQDRLQSRLWSNFPRAAGFNRAELLGFSNNEDTSPGRAKQEPQTMGLLPGKETRGATAPLEKLLGQTSGGTRGLSEPAPTNLGISPFNRPECSARWIIVNNRCMKPEFEAQHHSPGYEEGHPME